MSFERLADALGDRLNPVLVKELRQAVQGRFMASVLIAVLAILLVTLGIMISSQNDQVFESGVETSLGPAFFSAFYSLIFFTALFCLPIWTGARLLAERSAGSLDLIYATTLGPRKILSGKIGANAVIALALYSVSLPFVCLTYLLRGIDLPSILVVMCLSFAVVLIAVEMALFLAALVVSRLLRVVFGLGFLVFLLILYGTLVGVGIEMIEKGVGSSLATAGFWEAAGPVTLCLLFLAGLLWELSVALLKPSSANRALPVRAYVTLGWSLAGLGLWAWSLRGSPGNWLEGWYSLSLMLFLPALVVGVCGPEGLGPRLRRQLPRHPLLRSLAFPFWSGAVSGLVWASAMIAFSIGIGLAAGRGGSTTSWAETSTGLAAYGLAYCLAGLALRRRFFNHVLSPGRTWIPVLLLAALGTLLPPALALLVLPRGAAGLWLLPSLIAPFDEELRGATPAAGFAAAAFFTAVNLRWLKRQILDFKPAPNTSKRE